MAKVKRPIDRELDVFYVLGALAIGGGVALDCCLSAGLYTFAAFMLVPVLCIIITGGAE